MSTPKIARISITLPADLVRFADREARRLDRSRSWVIAGALRAAEGAGVAGTPAAAGTVGEPTISPYAGMEGELAEVRERRLRLALSWTPEERLRRAESIAGLARAAHPRRGRKQIVAFETFEEFWAWKKLAQASGTARS